MIYYCRETGVLVPFFETVCLNSPFTICEASCKLLPSDSRLVLRSR